MKNHGLTIEWCAYIQAIQMSKCYKTMWSLAWLVSVRKAQKSTKLAPCLDRSHFRSQKKHTQNWSVQKSESIIFQLVCHVRRFWVCFSIKSEEFSRVLVWFMSCGFDYRVVWRWNKTKNVSFVKLAENHFPFKYCDGIASSSRSIVSDCRTIECNCLNSTFLGYVDKVSATLICFRTRFEYLVG